MKDLIAATVDPSFPLVSNLSNVAAILGRLPNINWAGFYLYDEAKNRLYLGPFWGDPACILIPLGRGVCGTAAQRRETIVVPDVDAFPGHIACSSASRSEIVVPIIRGEQLLGVIDVDAPILDRFGEEDARLLQEVATILAEVWA